MIGAPDPDVEVSANTAACRRHAMVAYQFQVSLVDERRRIKRLPRLLTSHPRAGQLPQLIVDKRHQFRGSVSVALFSLREDDVVHKDQDTAGRVLIQWIWRRLETRIRTSMHLGLHVRAAVATSEAAEPQLADAEDHLERERLGPSRETFD